MTPTPRFAAPTTPADVERVTLTRNEAASGLRLSLTLVDKLIRAGVLPVPIPASTVAQLAQYPVLKVAEGELTVLRTDAREVAPPGEDRPWIGFHVTHSDVELEETSLRWWRSDIWKVLDNELFAVTVSTIPVAVYRITNHVNTIVRSDEIIPRQRYEGQLLARVYPGMEPSLLKSNIPGHLRGAVAQLMRSRIVVTSGGPIGYLNLKDPISTEIDR